MPSLPRSFSRRVSRRHGATSICEFDHQARAMTTTKRPLPGAITFGGHRLSRLYRDGMVSPRLPGRNESAHFAVSNRSLSPTAREPSPPLQRAWAAPHGAAPFAEGPLARPEGRPSAKVPDPYDAAPRAPASPPSPSAVVQHPLVQSAPAGRGLTGVRASDLVVR